MNGLLWDRCGLGPKCGKLVLYSTDVKFYGFIILQQKKYIDLK